jgi:hypothetical protein
MRVTLSDSRATLAYRVGLALDAVPERDEDAPLRLLAMMYAQQIDLATDTSEALLKLGHQLRATLVEMGLSPRARAALKDNADTASTGRLQAMRGAG